MAITLVETLIVIGVLVMLAALLLPALRTAREPARRNACTNNLRQLGLALDRYESSRGFFPAAHTVDADGNAMHSWRSDLLPMVEHSELAERIDFSEPWDSSENTPIHKTEVPVLLCPSSPEVTTRTNYLGVNGPGSFFYDATKRLRADVADGLDKTISVVDVGPDMPVHWMAPKDLAAEAAESFDEQTRTNHIYVIQVLFLDGHVEGLSTDVDPVIPPALLTIAAQDEIAE